METVSPGTFGAWSMEYAETLHTENADWRIGPDIFPLLLLRAMYVEALERGFYHDNTAWPSQ